MLDILVFLSLTKYLFEGLQSTVNVKQTWCDFRTSLSSWLGFCWPHHPSGLSSFNHFRGSSAEFRQRSRSPCCLNPVRLCNMFILFCFFPLATVPGLYNHDNSCFLHEDNSHLASSLLCWACVSEQRAAGQKSVLQIRVASPTLTHRQQCSIWTQSTKSQCTC